MVIPEKETALLIWETARPYFSPRYAPANSVIIGGADSPFAESPRRDGLIHRKTRNLTRRFYALFPTADFEVAHAWAATFGETDDGLA